jgi:uncharacterized protein (TIGR02271 family)
MANNEGRDDRFTALEDRFEGYEVHDRDGDKIGKVDDLFVDDRDNPEYVGVKMGFLGMNSTLIPMDICRVDESEQTITANTEAETAKDGPSFDADDEISRDFERQVRDHYGLDGHDDSDERGDYGAYYSDDDGDEREERAGTTSGREEDGDEVTVQRTEEELKAGTREKEREDGGVKVRKRTRTDREQVKVPTKHEEVSVERVSLDDGDSDSETIEQGVDSEEGEEVRMPVKEEEVVVQKQEVAKEEIRVNKDVVEEEEVIEEDVRKEEIEIEGEQRD